MHIWLQIDGHADTQFSREARRRLASAGVPDPELAFWLSDVVGHAVIHRAVVERPKELQRGQLAEELTTMLGRYIDRGRIRRRKTVARADSARQR